MPKEKISLLYRILHLFTYHPWLKIISLILAVIVWLYARDSIGRYPY